MPIAPTRPHPAARVPTDQRVGRHTGQHAHQQANQPIDQPANRQTGFTLIELLLVMVILAIATAGAALALRDTRHDLLDREAVRLAALLEAGRAQSRASGVPVLWHGSAQDFEFAGLPAPLKGQTGLPTHWETPVLLISGGRPDSLQDGQRITLILGPEPMIPAQQITLALPDSPQVRRTIHTDGLRPFVISDEDTP